MALCFKRVLSMTARLAILATATMPLAQARDLKITIPKRSQATPVQRLNREGVEAIQKHDYQKAAALFYKAYLFDPGDPFTLNNLGYVAELQGDAERAQSFYTLASSQGSDALVDRASARNLVGQSFQNVVSAVQNVPLQINLGNVRAVNLLTQGRLREAESVLQSAKALDPTNGFTLNNLGVLKESQGEYSEALKYYGAAADSHNTDTILVAMNSSWRGRPVTEVARENSIKLKARMKTLESSSDAEVAVLNLHGVTALNRNDWAEAMQNFSQAYKLNPDDAFSLNNQGYMAELNGDLETAQQFYRAAQQAEGAGRTVAVASRPVAEHTKLEKVANGSERDISTAIETASNTRRKSGAPIQLKHRDGTPVVEPAPTVEPAADTEPTAPPQK